MTEVVPYIHDVRRVTAFCFLRSYLRPCPYPTWVRVIIGECPSISSALEKKAEDEESSELAVSEGARLGPVLLHCKFVINTVVLRTKSV